MTAGPFPGTLSAATFFAFDYAAMDALCLEKIEIFDSRTSFDLLEKYYSWPWDVKNSATDWNSITGKCFKNWFYSHNQDPTQDPIYSHTSSAKNLKFTLKLQGF